jgi:hypothetical protein
VIELPDQIAEDQRTIAGHQCSNSREAAGASGFFTFTQSGERPER